MKDEDHRSEAVVSGSVDRKDYRRRNTPTDPLNSGISFSSVKSFDRILCVFFFVL